MNKLQQGICSEKAQDALAGKADRRREPRTRIARPVYVRSADPRDLFIEEVRTMTNFSRIGFYFITNRSESYREGMQLYVIPAFGCFNFEYVGEVVRLEPLPFGEHGVAIKLIRIGNPVFYTTPTAKLAPAPSGQDHFSALS